ncbi:MAG: hypothetical protein KDK51_05540 [Deltaproteobacteria bacterium]|nr:hypothetical protein [Deltaproteobacteria bacterium]
MTNKHATYVFVVSGLMTILLAGCAGQQSGVRTGQGNHANVTLAPTAKVTQTGRVQRSAFFSFQTTPQEAMQCQYLCANGQCTPRCQRVFHHYMSRGFGPNYFQYQPQTTLFGNLFGNNNQGAGYVFDYNQFHMADPQWISGYNQNLGQYHTFNNMNEFCQNPSAYMDESVNFGNCNNVDMRYLVGATQANNVLNYHINGRPNLVQTALQKYEGSCPRCYVIKYGTYWGKRNIAEENEVIREDFQRTWENFKNLPENVGLRLGNGILNVLMSRAMIPVAQIDARLAAMNFTATQQLNYYQNMATLAWNAAAIPVYMTGGTCDDAYAQVGQASGESRFVVGDVTEGDSRYVISCSDEVK